MSTKTAASFRRIAGLLDPDFYRQRYLRPDDGYDAVVEHFLNVGRFNRCDPNPLFDSAFYAAQLGKVDSNEDLVTHYISSDAGSFLRTHQLFDPDYYQSLAGPFERDLTPLEHYRKLGWREGISPHPLFDSAYYLKSAGIDDDVGDALCHYLQRDVYDTAPSRLFSDAYYVADIHRRIPSGSLDAYLSGPPLVHYVKHGFKYVPQTHPLFDAGLYRERWMQLQRERQRDTQATSHVDWLRHYIEFGWRHRLSPSRFFDAEFYLGQLSSEIEVDALSHYLEEGFRKFSPHPGIDLEHYSRLGGIDQTLVPSVLYILATPQDERVSPHPFFDREFYRAAYPDLAQACPVLHFIEHGISEDRSPNEFFSKNYVYAGTPSADFSRQSALRHHLAQPSRGKVRILVVSHAASLTGAPGTALRILEHFSGLDNVECFAFVGAGGERLADFERLAHVHSFGQAFYRLDRAEITRCVDRLLAITQDNPIAAAIVNSAESRFIVPILARWGIPVITLVHEAADLYSAGEFDELISESKRVIFGSNYVLDRTKLVCNTDNRPVVVRGQGLQQPHIGSQDRASSRQMVLEELSLPEDTFLVLGCGTVDYRKGADLFVQAAANALKSAPPGRPVCFVWVGGSEPTEFVRFLHSSIRSERLEKEIRFIGQRADTMPYFAAADVFLMTSRVDPFPCVSQEAMATGVPVLAFEGGGGTVEMIVDGGGHAVPLGDIYGMAGKLIELMKDEPLRLKTGRKAKSIAEARWRPEDYGAYLESEVEKIADLGARDFGKPKVNFIRDTRYVLIDQWSGSLQNWEAVSLVKLLQSDGCNAELVLTSGRFGISHFDSLRDCGVPVRILQPSATYFDEGRWRASATALSQTVIDFSKRAQPCTFVFFDAAVSMDAVSSFPDNVATLRYLASPGSKGLTEAYHLAPYFTGMLAASPSVLARIGDLYPSAAARAVRLMRPLSKKPQKVLGKANRRIVLRVATLNDVTAAELLDFCTEMRRMGVSIQVVADGYASRRSMEAFCLASGLGRDEIAIGESEAEIRKLLSQADCGAVLGDDPASEYFFWLCWSEGKVPVAINGSADMCKSLAISGAGLAVHGNGRVSAAALGRFLASPAGQRDRLAAAHDWNTAVPGGRKADLTEEIARLGRNRRRLPMPGTGLAAAE